MPSAILPLQPPILRWTTPLRRERYSIPRAFPPGAVKTSTSCPAEIKAGDENADYTGAYVSFTSTETRWHNIFLTPKYDLGEYAEYDLAEVWLYADANDGTEVGFSFFNDVNYNFRFPSDTWTKITLDMEDFIAKMGENNAIFLPFNTNNPSSTNHASLTELRLGGVFAKYAVEYSVEAEGLNIAPGAEQAEVSLTVASDRSALPAFSLTVTKDGREIPPASSETNVFGYTLSAGSYEYKVVSRDDMYRGRAYRHFYRRLRYEDNTSRNGKRGCGHGVRYTGRYALRKRRTFRGKSEYRGDVYGEIRRQKTDGYHGERIRCAVERRDRSYLFL